MSRRILFRLRSLTEQTTDRVLFVFGVCLSLSEAYKQLFLYAIINGRHYDWWFFPFQLCSLPMYLCLLIPLLNAPCRRRGRGPSAPAPRRRAAAAALCTFMQDYNLLGGVAALIVPEGFTHIHWSLTLHGYLWHGLLIVIGLFIWLTGRSKPGPRGFAGTIPVFAFCCVTATMINVLTPGRGRADMFYISPYHLNTQPLFHWLATRIGGLPADILYLMTICLGAFLLHCGFSRLDDALSCRP